MSETPAISIEPASGAAPPDLRDRTGIWSLAAASAISNFGNMLTYLAIPWFVLSTTGSATRTGLVAGVVTFAPAIAGLIGGPVVDRLGFKRTSMLADLASGVTVALIPTLYLLDLLAYWHILVLTLLSSALDVPGHTARQALVPGLARRAGVPLERANSIMQLSWTLVSYMLGAAVGGLIISLIGPAQALLVDAGTFGVSILIVGLAVRPPAGTGATNEPDTEDEGGYASQLLVGLRLVVRDPVLMAIIPAVVLANFVGTGFSAVMLPVYARDLFGSASIFGLLVAVSGAGSTVGTLLYGIWGSRVRRYRVVLVMFGMYAAAIWIFSLLTYLPVAIAARFLWGLSTGPINAVTMVLIQSRAPEHMLGRVLGVLVTFSSVAAPAGVLASGLAVDAVGLQPAMIAAAALVALVPLWLGLSPRARVAAPAFDV